VQQVHVGEEQLFPGQLYVVGDADVADVATGPGGADGLHYRLLGADRLDDAVRAEPVGEVLDPGDAVAALGDDVGVVLESCGKWSPTDLDPSLGEQADAA
jgi:hypothetical protein